YLNGVYVPDYTGYDFSEYEPSAGVYDPGYYSAYLVKNMSRSQPGAYPNNLDCAIVGKIDVPHSFYGWLQTMIYYDLWEKGDIGYFDVSKDGTTWTTLSSYAGTLSGNADCGFYYYGSHFSLATKSANDLIWWTSLASYFVTQYLSNPQLYVRFRFVSNATQPYAEAGFGYMQGVTFYGMSDNHAPVTTLSMAGTMDPLTHFYTTSVILTLTATDDVTGVKAIYYILDGIQHTYTGPITVSTDGTHTFSYWAVDNEGNIEAAKSIPDFKIDLTGPTVTLTAPTTGALYLFGNHLLDLKSGKTIFLFGGIPVAATASSTDAPITTVQFFADGTLFAEDTTAPYTATFSQKHSGALVLTAKAVDLLGHVATSAPINIDNYIHIGP
ncbi:MAG: Ig-like domain-containing protein, partial [Euryarchaeota archaeon]|nr:Ig-like domain-containing protein [Euryarchaeota archaeon]